MLAAILLLLVAVGATYYIRAKVLRAHTVAPPKPLPAGMVASSDEGWHYSRTDNVTGKPIVEVHARGFQQLQEPAVTNLDQVELRLYDKTAVRYDEVKCAKARFIEAEKRLYSEGDVEIRMGIPAEGPMKGRLVSIRTSGATFETETGKANTDRPTEFHFEGGDGKAVGAEYDPAAHILHLKSAVELNWRPVGPRAKPMKIEAGELIYREVEARIYLMPWSRLTRDTLKMDAAEAQVTLQQDVIRNVDAVKAHGVDKYPTRAVEYQAERLFLTMDDDGVAKQLTAERDARLISRSKTGETTVAGDKVDLDFDTATGDSQLTKALAQGHAVVTSKPAATKGQAAPETRLMRSEVIYMEMRPGGHEIRRASTLRPGDVEFIPNAPTQRHRTIHGEALTIDYAAGNRIERFHATKATTRTEPLASKKPLKPGQPPPAPALTSSDDFLARFQPKTGQLETIDQTGNFHYEEGERKATAAKAALDSPKNLITLTTDARIWDNTGSTMAERIVLDQKSGDFLAEGKVSSTRQPEQKKGTGTAMLDREKVMQAQAAKMTSRERNSRILYEGNAVLWQESNRIAADSVDINRDEGTLQARGHVVTRMVDNSRQQVGKPAEGAIFTSVQAPAMDYNDDEKLAHYHGGVILVRPGMNIRSKELKAFLVEDKNGSSLHHAFADGAVQIVQTAPDRTRTGTSEHAEYYVADDKVVLSGGRPLLVDSVKGETRGETLTYYSKTEHLIVASPPKQPGVSTLKKKTKKKGK